MPRNEEPMPRPLRPVFLPHIQWIGIRHRPLACALLLAVVAPRTFADPSPPLASDPLTPVIGLSPEALDFGRLCTGICRDLPVSLRNVGDPGSDLIISNLVISPPFTLMGPPATPFMIPADGSVVTLTVHYCAAGIGPENGVLTVASQNAPVSSLLLPMNGVSDPPPECDPGGPYQALPTQAITFDARGSSDPGGTIVTYAWDFGDGATGQGVTAIHAYAQPGSYEVRLTLTDDCGGVSSCITPAAVNPNQPPICEANGPYAHVAGHPILMSALGSSDPDGHIVAYRWDFGDGERANGFNVSHSYSAPGLYTVELTVVDMRGGTTTCGTTAEIVAFNDPPICHAGGPYLATLGQPVTFDGSASSDPEGEILSYRWQFGDCATGIGTNPTHTYLPGAEVYAVSLCVSDRFGAMSCCTAEVQMESRPLGQATPSEAPMRPMGANPLITLPLHATLECNECTPVPSIDCRDRRPTVNVPPHSNLTIYLLANNYSMLAGVQTAFEWSPDWVLLGAEFDCLAGQVTTILPGPPGGAKAGTLHTTFDCINHAQLLVLGRLILFAGSTGCLSQVESSYPSGTYALDCAQLIDAIPEIHSGRLGRICIDSNGVDACPPIIGAVQPATWGQVKATYR
jgi:PKD repeat protein